jgi:hypothetical protein
MQSESSRGPAARAAKGSTQFAEENMAEWLFDRHGSPRIILDDDCVRSASGRVVGWISGDGLFSVTGRHIGWYEGGVIYDNRNRVLGFTYDASGHLPSRPGTSGTPGIPGLSGRPGRPGLSGISGRPGYAGWSDISLTDYFKTD